MAAIVQLLGQFCIRWKHPLAHLPALKPTHTTIYSTDWRGCRLGGNCHQLQRFCQQFLYISRNGYHLIKQNQVIKCATMRFCNQLLLLGLYFQRVLSAKDAHYFTPGTSNPNVDHPLYWRDAVNILQDLDQFQYLYVSFNSCAWSLFGNGQQIMNCGGNGWEKSNWYMGHTACFRANAAFELYGVLKQSYGGSGNDDGCGQSTYINSVSY